MAALLAEAEQRFPGGSNGNSIYQDVVISHGKGSRIFDADGKEYVDYVMGGGPMMLGHGIPTPLSPLFLRRFPPVLRRTFAVLSALSGFLAPRRRERARNGGKWAKFGGETAEKQRWLSGAA